MWTMRPRHTSVLVVLLVVLPLFFVNAQHKAKGHQYSASQLRALGNKALSSGNVRQALKFFNQLIELEPKSQYNYYMRANVFLRLRYYKRVLSDLDKALELDPKFVKGLVHRGKIRTLLGDCDLAVRDYQSALQLRSSAQAQKGLERASQCASEVATANGLFKQNRYQEAKRHLSAALVIASDSISLLLLRSRCNVELRDHHAVLFDTRLILKQDKNNLDALALRGRAYYTIGEESDIDTALSHFRMGLRLDPEHKELKKQYKAVRKVSRALQNGKKFRERGQWEQAVKFYRDAIKLDPNHDVIVTNALVAICDVQVKAGQGKEAVDTCSQAVNRDERKLEAWLNRGEALLLEEKYQEAINNYQKANELFQNNQQVQEGLRNAQLEEKKSKRKNYYKILGVNKRANKAQIKRAYRKMALKWHPDKHKPEDKKKAEKTFQDVGEAYEILSDPEKRGKYDRGEDVHVQEGFNPFQHFQQGGSSFTFHFS